MKKGNKGFTLIELLVVIAIIAILSTVVMAGLNSARMKGRDAKRLSDIKQLQTALELCFDAGGGGYPVVAASTLVSTALSATALPNACGTGIPFTNFMNPLPVAPTPSATPAGYMYSATASSYSIVFGLEGQSGSLGSGSHTATPSGIMTP